MKISKSPLQTFRSAESSSGRGSLSVGFGLWVSRLSSVSCNFQFTCLMQKSNLFIYFLTIAAVFKAGNGGSDMGKNTQAKWQQAGS